MSRFPRKSIIILFVILVVTFLAHFPGLKNGFVNWDDPNSIASATIVNDSHTVVKSRGKGINCYIVDDFDNELSGYPEQVQKALKLNDLNFQRQRDSFFLVDKSAGEVGRQLNTVIDLEVIDRSLTHAKRRKNNYKTEVEYLEKDLEQEKEELEKQKQLQAQQEEIRRIKMPSGSQCFGLLEQRLGGSRMLVRCLDGKTRVCRIPGRLKRKIWIRDGDIVLVEPWELSGDTRGDVLFKYKPNQVRFLKQRGLLKGLEEEEEF